MWYNEFRYRKGEELVKPLIKVLQAVDQAKISTHEDLSSYLSFFNFDVENIVKNAKEKSYIEQDGTYQLSLDGKLLLVQYEIEKILKTEITNLQLLHKGLTNQSFMFEILDDKYVFRMPGKGVSNLINRYEEKAVYRLIKDLKISDEIVYINPDKGYKITRFIKNAQSIHSDDPKDIKKAMSLLRTLHDAKLESEHTFEITERIEYYYRLCLAENVQFHDGFDAHYHLVKSVIEAYKKISRPKVLCHVDTAQSNFIKHGILMTLLDWEYSGMSDPLLDVAMFANSCGFNREAIDDLLITYLKRAYTQKERLVIDYYMALSGFLWGLWSYVKEIYGEDHTSYKKRQFALSLKYCNIILDK